MTPAADASSGVTSNNRLPDPSINLQAFVGRKVPDLIPYISPDGAPGCHRRHGAAGYANIILIAAPNAATTSTHLAQTDPLLTANRAAR